MRPSDPPAKPLDIEPGEPPGQIARPNDQDVRAGSPLDLVVGEERRHAGRGREEEIAGLDEADLRHLAVDREVGGEAPKEADAEPADLDVDAGAVLLADRARGQRRGGVPVARVALDDAHGAVEGGIAGQPVGDGTADRPTAHDDDALTHVNDLRGQ